MSTQVHLPSQMAVPPVRMAEVDAINACYFAGDGLAIRRLRSQLQRIAPYFRMALITGEAGTGKETVARALHERSAGAGGPFVAWRATEFAEKLIEDGPSAHAIREAHHGTLFLDGIGAMPHAIQSRLLRLLQEQDALRSQRCDLRIVAASDRELRTLTTTGQFREDLYRRIAAVEIALTPLRARQEDIAAVAGAWLRRIAGAGSISAEAVTRLLRHPWPGNVRELGEVLERAALMAEGAALEPEHLPVFDRRGLPPQVAEQHLEKLQDVVQRHVLDVLTQCAGNKLRAAEVLGISRSTLYRMLDACSAGNGSGFTD